LYEWQSRRERLICGGEDAGLYTKVRLRVLDYLIHRYSDSSEAQRPATTGPSTDVHVNDRAIVVLHHVWDGRVRGIKTWQEAEARMAAILKRINSHDSAAESETGGAAVLAAENPDDDRAIDPAVWSRIAAWACRYFREGEPKISPRADRIIAAALAENPFPPQAVALYLYQRIVKPGSKDLRAAELLIQGRNRIALNYVVYAWRELAASGRTDNVRKVLDEFLAETESVTVDDGLHESLAHGSALVRLAALEILGRIAALKDVSLLNDLLALPPAADEHPSERPAMIRTMWRIAQAAR
jgi:hypothetical protein